jgi:hypothetical protein
LSDGFTKSVVMYVVNKGRRTGLVEIQTTVRLTILKLALELNIIDDQCIFLMLVATRSEKLVRDHCPSRYFKFKTCN